MLCFLNLFNKQNYIKRYCSRRFGIFVIRLSSQRKLGVNLFLQNHTMGNHIPKSTLGIYFSSQLHVLQESSIKGLVFCLFVCFFLYTAIDLFITRPRLLPHNVSETWPKSFCVSGEGEAHFASKLGRFFNNLLIREGGGLLLKQSSRILQQ